MSENKKREKGLKEPTKADEGRENIVLVNKDIHGKKRQGTKKGTEIHKNDITAFK
jgi:hypothetical protein